MSVGRSVGQVRCHCVMTTVAWGTRSCSVIYRESNTCHQKLVDIFLRAVALSSQVAKTVFRCRLQKCANEAFGVLESPDYVLDKKKKSTFCMFNRAEALGVWNA